MATEFMPRRRVVVTGMGMVSPLGVLSSEVWAQLKAQQNAVKVWEPLAHINGMGTRLAAPVTATLPVYPRRQARSMGRIGMMAVWAAEQALVDAELSGSPELQNGRTGVAAGSCAGSAQAVAEEADFVHQKDVKCLNATTYAASMPHMVPVNLSLYFGLHGRLIPTSTACTSGAQGIGYAAEAIRFGLQDMMLAGGAEELSPLSIGVFDALFADSTTEDPQKAPRPFAKDRDGLVVGEGAGILVLEELGHAQARGAHIYAEIVGFGTCSDASHITSPNAKYMAESMRLALNDAGLAPSDIGYINAHGTATQGGDLAEGQAMLEVFGDKVPVSSLKSYMGHTLGAAGALEAAMTILMQQHGWFSPNLNLETVDPNLAGSDLIVGAGRELEAKYVMSNNFAFGGVDTSLIFKKYEA